MKMGSPLLDCVVESRYFQLVAVRTRPFVGLELFYIILDRVMDYKVIQDYVITPVVLGKGCFGTVYRGYMKNNKNQILAVKAIPLNSIKNEDIIRREIEILLKLDNPNIVKYWTADA